MLLSTLKVGLLVVLIFCPFLGLFYAWSQWPGNVYATKSKKWQRTLGIVGLLSVTLQAASFIALWTPISRNNAFMALCVPMEFLLLLITIPALFMWKGSARWWLLVSSVALFIDSFFLVLAELAY